MTSDDLAVVREHVDWMLGYGPPGPPEQVAAQLYGGAWACGDLDWHPPDWLLKHQRTSAIRVAGTLQTFNGAILADAVGLGKTYIALGVATRYRRVVVSVPAALKRQWQDAARSVDGRIEVLSHESLSRGGGIPPCDLLVVDEAHWFRNPKTKRYDSLARGIGPARVLLVTATPVVNGPTDLVHLLRLFLPDNGLRAAGLASIEAPPDLDALALAAAVVTVSGSDRMAPVFLPRVRDVTHRCSTLDADREKEVLNLIATLRFPNFGGIAARQLLRNHILLRLASSAAAFLATVRGHLRYLGRVRHGDPAGPATRAALRALCGEHDETQLDFLSLLSHSGTTTYDRQLLQREEDLLDRLIRVVCDGTTDPKLELLRQVVASGCGSKLIVFTGAAATASALAARLDWHRTAVATGRGSRISSGRISLDEVLDAFSPRSRAAPDPASCLGITTLVATDLASEGLNLQDAESLVHYDLPWNPVRLQQRLGRIRRIGSQHPDVSVTWFLPSERLEKTLELPTLIERKSLQQIRFGVPATTTVGRSLSYNRVLEQRQLLGGSGRPTNGIAGHLVVRGTGAVVCLRWQLGQSYMFETVAIASAGATADPHIVGALLETLGGAPQVTEPAPGQIHRHILTHVRRRVRLLQRVPPADERLHRRVLMRARKAGKERDSVLVRRLDRVLDALQKGMPAGPERAITDWLDGRIEYPKYVLDTCLNGAREFHGVAIVAALFGNKFG